jgi:hypothetical protein
MATGHVGQNFIEWTCVAWTYAIHEDTDDPFGEPCDFPEVQSDPILIVGGTRRRLIARTGTSTRRNDALNAALGEVDDILADGCTGGTPPITDRDPYHLPPYDIDGIVRLVCVSTTVITSPTPGPDQGGGCH